MPGRHSGAPPEAPLSREHARIAGKTLKMLWSADQGVPTDHAKVEILGEVNSAFVQAGLTPLYTLRKLNDAISNRLYTYRRKRRRQNSQQSLTQHANNEKSSCACTMDIDVNVSGTKGGQSRWCDEPSVTMPAGVDISDPIGTLPCGDDWLNCLDVNALPTPPSSPPKSPSSHNYFSCQATLHGNYSYALASAPSSCMDSVYDGKTDLMADSFCMDHDSDFGRSPSFNPNHELCDIQCGTWPNSAPAA